MRHLKGWRHRNHLKAHFSHVWPPRLQVLEDWDCRQVCLSACFLCGLASLQHCGFRGGGGGGQSLPGTRSSKSKRAPYRVEAVLLYDLASKKSHSHFHYLTLVRCTSEAHPDLQGGELESISCSRTSGF